MNNLQLQPAPFQHLQTNEELHAAAVPFSSYVMIGNLLMALDRLKKRLLIFSANAQLDRPFIISIDDAKAVSIKKVYTRISAGSLKSKRLEDFLQCLILKFEFRKRKALIFSVYDRDVNDIDDLPILERKVRKLQSFLHNLIRGYRKVVRPKNAKKLHGGQS